MLTRLIFFNLYITKLQSFSMLNKPNVPTPTRPSDTLPLGEGKQQPSFRDTTYVYYLQTKYIYRTPAL